MTVDALPAPGWPMRARLLAADLVTFDASRLGWVLAVRAILGLALPLLLGHVLNQPYFVWIGLGAYLLTIGDCIDDGDRAQPLRILTGAVLGSVALGIGVLAGGSLSTAVAGMLVWGVLTGMMGIYGSAFATMSLPVVWAYVELGLPATEHTMANALLISGMFALGGMLALSLALLLRFGGTFAPVRAQTATCYREIARYLAAEQSKGFSPPETRVRGAIAEARRRAVQARQAAPGTSHANQRALVLIEIVDRLYSIAGAMREVNEPPDPGCTAALLAIADVLNGRAKLAELRRLQAALKDQVTAEGVCADLGSRLFRGRMTLELSHALSVAADDELPVLPDISSNPARRLSELLSPLRANLDLTSVIARHALRFAVVTSAAVIVFWFFPKPFGYWVPLTATVILKPFTGMTLTRAVQRAIGTGIGILIGLALMPLLPTAPLQFTAVILLFFAMMLVLPFNYSLAILFLSVGLIPFEHVLTPGIQAATGSDRLVATAIGALLAITGGHVLWPSYERRTLPDLLRTCAGAMSTYADTVIGTAQGETSVGDMQAERRRAGLALSNLQAGVQRSLTEIGGDANATTAFLRASIALQRLSKTLNTLLHAAPAIAPSRPALAAFRLAFVPALADLHRCDTPVASLRAAIPAADRSAETAFLSGALERLTLALEMLQAATVSAAFAPRQHLCFWSTELLCRCTKLPVNGGLHRHGTKTLRVMLSPLLFRTFQALTSSAEPF